MNRTGKDFSVTQPWIYKSMPDLIFILLPPFLSLLIVFAFPGLFRNPEGIPDLVWLLLIVFVDVAHVYSTLYRTYFDAETFQKQKGILISIPIFVFILAVVLYSIAPLLFWRILAYLAVYHFIRQQYGFMRIYSRKEKVSRIEYWVDTITIYSATLYPVLYWHMHGPRNFNWFVDNDFLYFQSGWLSKLCFGLYVIILIVYVGKEINIVRVSGKFNLPKNLVVTGTALSWYFGIVYFNGDLIFTLLNVVSHGIPYMALVWMYGRKQEIKERHTNVFLQKVFSGYGWLIFLMTMVCFAYFEEGIWDVWIWKDHTSLFQPFSFLPVLKNATLLNILVPLLTVPQATHYIIDGFIWRLSKGETFWAKKIL
ncbi:MAG TPA: hypothetical protein PKL85_03385 [Bacteroidia bacterium]|nr:hypothetical protein [Bacteroidia bacterium]